uniref:Uncharacterized protein n=1 Tax=Avena sativa TaxID=4498 RepID=A0ACD5Z3S1_AVESA
MIPRRFINLMMKDLRVGGSYWLSRLRPEENLFYGSAKEAAAAGTEARREKRKPKRESTRQLPSPDFRFKSSRSKDSTLGFMPFYDVGGGPKEGRIVVSDSAGHTHLYDAEENSGEMLPPTREKSNWHRPISVCIDAKDAVRADALYVINASNSTNFKTLAYCNGDIMSWNWIDLPLPPYFLGKEDRTIKSYTLLDDNKTICFSSVSDGGFGTYCFDTANLEWTKAGSWTLPFTGRAVRVPQLYNLHFGFHRGKHENIVALELPSPLDDGDAPPKVLYQWRGFRQPEVDHEGNYWSSMDSNLLYLGNNRFCAAQFFGIFHGSEDFSDDLVDTAAVLTGLEIVNGQANKAKLRMINHKTRTYVFEGSSIESVF